ncbi:MAG: hypothetical protein NVSMB4_00500 [Acidimicrobiales bacterium]
MPGKYASPYAIRIVDALGVIYAEYSTTANIQEVTWELNGPGRMVFDIPTDAPNASSILVGGQREAQVWYDAGTAAAPVLIWWGVIMRREAVDAMTSVQCEGLLSYYKRLHFGPVLNNYLTNGNFDIGSPPSSWTAVNCTLSSDTVIKRMGAQSAKLVTAAQGTDSYISQQFSVTAGAGLSVTVFAAAWFYITATSGTTYLGPALAERGLYMKRISAGVDQTEPTTGVVGVYTQITNSAPRNGWARIYSPPTVVPAGTTQTVEVRCYGTGGTINWDDSVAVIEESTGANTANGYADIVAIVANVNAYANDTTKNKPNLHILSPANTIGTSIQRQYQFYDHGTIWDACFKSLIDEGICDIGVTWNAAGTTRTLTCVAKAGSVKPQLALILGGNVAGFSYVEDGTQTASCVRVLHQGFNHAVVIGQEGRSKAAVDVGYAVDTAANGGITLDVVLTAAPETPLDGLVTKATTELARRKNPVQIPTFHTRESLAGSLIGQISVGDTIPFIASYGWVNENSNRRVVAMTLTPNSDTLSVTGN